MIKIEKVKVYGFEEAIRGMRNPKNSWDKSDSFYIKECNHQPNNRKCDACKWYDDIHKECLYLDCYENDFIIGKEDYELMLKLSKAGTDHSKYLRMITVCADIIAPIYWVAEHDTYKVGTVRNSCSFMHKGLSKPFEITDFSIQNNLGCWEQIIDTLNNLRNLYLETKDDNIFKEIRQLLPQGYNVRYTWQANYQVLKNIYHARKNHKLDEWHTFCDWIETLPYSNLICTT